MSLYTESILSCPHSFTTSILSNKSLATEWLLSTQRWWPNCWIIRWCSKAIILFKMYVRNITHWVIEILRQYTIFSIKLIKAKTGKLHFIPLIKDTGTNNNLLIYFRLSQYSSNFALITIVFVLIFSSRLLLNELRLINTYRNWQRRRIDAYTTKVGL